MNIEVDIRKLVLHGAPAADAAQVRAAMVPHPGLVQNGDLSASLLKTDGAAAHRLEFRAVPESAPGTLDAQVAETVAKGLTP